MATAEVSGVREVASRRRCTEDDYCVAPDSLHPRVGKITYEDGVFRHDVDLRELPDFAALKDEVARRVAAMSWWQAYGADTCVHLGGVVGAVASFWLLSSHNLVVFATGVLLLGCCHSILAIKGGHLAAHRAACRSVFWNRLLGFFFSDMCGTFPSDASYEIHVKGHHPHTNIIGLGDSSTFKAPFLPAYVYLFIAPLFLPVITPVVAVTALWGRWLQLARFLAIASLGLCASLCLLTTVSGCTFLGALAVTVVSRAVLAIPYIHINIFQHIGLPMFSARHRPKRLYQMSVGVLNLSRNPLLELCFGHGIISCHVEHHLFPRLSDQQCLRVKPLVQRFLKANGLPYHEASYTDRLGVFLARYSQLMVNAPPISHFVGIQ